MPPVTGNSAVQLGSFKDEGTARDQWRLLSAKHAELASVSPIVERVDLGEKGIWFRLKGGSVDPATARDICNKLKDANVACIVAAR